MVTLQCVCPVCKGITKLELPEQKYQRWQMGEKIQQVFPELTATERETIISGVCSDACWDKLWGPQEL